MSLDNKEGQYSTTFSGLKSTAITAGAFIVGGILIKETLQRLRRYPDEDARRGKGENVPDRGMEGWAMGYLYRARTFVAGAKTPDYPRWPLAWAWEAYKRDEKFFEEHCGPDATVYVRFLRGALFWVSLHLCTTFPILLAINFVYSPDSVSTNSIDRASLSSLVQNHRGLHLLPIHVVFVWLVIFTWVGQLVWLGYGALRVRRNELRRLLRDEVERSQPLKERDAGYEFTPDLDPVLVQEDERGWRYRTVLVRNIPPLLRTEDALRGYFEQYLRESPRSSSSATDGNDVDPTAPKTASPLQRQKGDIPLQDRKSPPSSAPTSPSHKLIAEVVLVRRAAELNELYAKYGEVLHQLETAHVQLARNVMAWVRERVDKEEALNAERRGEVREKTPWEWWKERLPQAARKKGADIENDAREGDDLLLTALRPFLLPSSLDTPLPPPPTNVHGAPLTLWDALHALHSAHPTLLDRFQPLYRLRHFRHAHVPALDYYLAKHNLLFCLIEDKRARLDDEFEPASTAFITFSRAADARRARKELAWRPIKRIYHGRVLDCKVKMAPEVRDLHWDRLVLVSLSSDLLRGTLLQVFIWLATLFWLLPISFLIGLLSLESLKEHLPALAAYLERNTVANSLFTSLLPTAILAVLNMFVPTVLGIIQRKGKTLITESKWSQQTQAVYWKFVAINFLIIFCIGITAFTSLLNVFSALRQPESVLSIVAAAFPKGATFFTSYVLLQAGIHTGIELSLLGISWINHGSIRKFIAPRKRFIDGAPRFFGFQSWVPNHLFVVSICLIFAVLNPLVVAFGFIYFCLAVIVFKQQFGHVYWRRHFEGGGRVVFRRIFRYSLDICILSEVVYVAFFFTLKRISLGAACIPLIPLTVAVKILGTRYFDHLMDEIEEAQIDIICGEGNAAADLSVPLDEEDRDLHLSLAEAYSTVKTFATVTLPALALRPASKLPRVASPSKLAAHWKARSEATTARRSRTNSFQNGGTLVRMRSHTSPDDWRRPMLETIMSRDETATEEGFVEASPALPQRQLWPTPGPGGEARQADGVEAQVGEKAQPPPPPAGAPVSLVEEAFKVPLSTAAVVATHAHESALVTPHAPVIRDDRPVSHLRYRSPAETVPLSRSLWLPRDPLKPVDLGDTVDYHGRALVSSEGGRGVIGSWEENPSKGEEDEDEDEDEGGTDEMLGPVNAGPAIEAAPHSEQSRAQKDAAEVEPAHARSTSNDMLMPSSPRAPELVRRGSRLSVLSHDAAAYTLKGNERIRVAADVAARIEAEQGGRQLSVFDGGIMRRRASSSASSQRPSSIFSGLQRRGTRVSSAGDGGASMMVHSPHHSPVLLRHPDEPKPSPPAIPAFTEEPVSLDPSPTGSTPPRESSAYPFPPPSPTLGRRATHASLSPSSPSRPQPGRDRSPSAVSFAASASPTRPINRDRSPSDLSTGAGSRLSIGSPTSHRFPPSSASFLRSPTRTRTQRSASGAPSLQFSATLGRTSEEDQEIVIHPTHEGDESAPAVSLSQAAALRAELLEEERRAHEQYQKKHEQRLERERRDTEDGGGAGWLRRLLVRSEADGEADET
ncbi:hypothetical protein JCM10213_005601 [Rhodosporidiobolus nylandii]